jgi:hypothetical protein
MTAGKAFQFCVTYKRTTEFRRLCDTLRNHLANLNKYASCHCHAIVYGVDATTSALRSSQLQMHVSPQFLDSKGPYAILLCAQVPRAA